MEPLIIHPLAERFFPMMPADELQALAEDIKSHGQLDPITLFEGQILDGRNRYAACVQLGQEPTTAVFTGTEAEAAAFVMSKNRRRRHLNASQRAMAEAAYREFYQQGMKERMREGGRSGGTISRRGRKTIRVTKSLGNPYPDETTTASLPTKPKDWAHAAAQVAGVSHASISKAKQILDSGKTDVIAEVRAGTLSLDKARERLEPTPTQKGSSKARKRAAGSPGPQKVPGAVKGEILKSLKYFWHLAPADERHEFLAWVATLEEHNARTHPLQQVSPRFSVTYTGDDAPAQLRPAADAPADDGVPAGTTIGIA